MDKTEIKNYFDAQAHHWDADMIKSDEKIGLILDGADITADNAGRLSILDVACGTGVMIPYYGARGAKDITGVDISPKMIEIAREKFPEVNFLVGDVENVDFGRSFDRIVVYNAFPHFPSGVNLVERLTEMLAPGGTLTVAHGMSRKQIDNHHKGGAALVSCGLISSHALRRIFEYFGLEVTVEISDDRMYQVTGRKTI